MNLHIDPSLTESVIKDQFARVARACGSRQNTSSFVVGDFNFLEVGEARYSVSNGLERVPAHRLAIAFSRTFQHFTELVQPHFTHRTPQTDNTSYARLDRIYTNMPSVDILDFTPTSGTVWDISDTSLPSDHTAVFFGMKPFEKGSDVPNVAGWICKHPKFPELVGELISGNQLHPDPPARLLFSKLVLPLLLRRSRVL